MYFVTRSSTLLLVTLLTVGCAGPEQPGGRRRGFIQGVSGPVEISYEQIGEQAIFENDIVVEPVDTLEELTSVFRTSSVGRTSTFFRWGGGVIPYTIDASLTNSTPSRANIVNEAIAHWERLTRIKFLPRRDQTSYVTFRSGNGCTSSVGRLQTGGQQFITLGAGCGVPAAIHEIGHAVGLWHEQSADERDQWVSINWSNITQPFQDAVKTISARGVDGMAWGPYDYSSVMHYPSRAGADAAIDPTKPILTKRDGTEVPASSGLSLGDMMGVEQMYGTFAFSYRGTMTHLYPRCIRIAEPQDPHTWNDNYLCMDYEYGVRWSYDGPIAGMRCTQVSEPSDGNGWDDNYLCVPNDSPFFFSWSNAGPLPNRKCIPFYEPADPNTWNDNYLCYEDRRVQWSSNGPIAGLDCRQISEPADPNTWNDNYLCIKNIGDLVLPTHTMHRITLDWSFSGPRPFRSGYEYSGDPSDRPCTQILESADPHTWNDNFICTSSNSSYAALQFSWSSAGPIAGRYCIQIIEAADPHTWADNYLCF